jgi:hypothetical protein
MKHLEFANELQKLGIHLSSTNVVSKSKEFEIPGVFKNNVIICEDFKLRWKEKTYNEENPIKALLRTAVDMDEWKHSWHIEMIPENYEKIERIIQDKIIKRAKEIDDLMLIYFQLHYEMSNEHI